MFSTMWKPLWGIGVVLSVASAAAAQQKAKPAQPSEVAAQAGASEATSPTAMQENTLAMCEDGADNDGDGHVDCADQDCEIYAICVRVEQSAPVDESVYDGAAVEVLPAPPPPEPVFVPERGHLCQDGLDNNGDGKIDCYEASCARSRYCRKIMYERPESPKKAPGLFMNIGLGVAMPNYRMPTMETTDWKDADGDSVPFDPDMGIMLDFQVGYLFLKFMGAGVNFKSAFTFASNRTLHFQTSDDPDDYKYTGNKYYGNLGAFVRFQWPFKMVTPFLNAHVGYSVAQATWNIYDPDNDWDDIDDYEFYDNEDYLIGEQEVERSDRYRHFTFALEPGVEVSVIQRLFYVGVRAWLPVIANKDSSMDNVGILLSFGFTPTWREPMQLRPEFSKTQP